MRLTLVAPQLIWPEPDDKSALVEGSCPALEWLQAHGKAGRQPRETYEKALAGLFGLDANAPFGSLRLLGESANQFTTLDVREGVWLCADPVHLRFYQERIILADAGALELSDDEAHALAACLNREFIEVGRFHVAHARRWYVQLKDDSSFAVSNFSQPLSAVAGHRIHAELPGDPHLSKLRSWLNEVQMFLHGHPVNLERAGTGKPAVNSLWLWGSGRLPQTVEANYDEVWSNDPIAIGLARASGIPVHSIPCQLNDLVSHAARDSRQLVVLDDLLAPALYEDSKGWHETLMRLDKEWFLPLRSALGTQVDEILLLAPTAYGLLTWQLNSNDRWKFWRRPQPLAALARELAQ